MLPELGNFALIIALCFALTQSIFPLIGSYTNHLSWMTLSRRTALGQFVFLVIAFLILEYSFITNDFSVLYVANNSNTALPLFYRITALWGAHEGSLLLWASILGFWTTAVALFSRSLPLYFVARVLSVMGMISVGFLLFMLCTSNPFIRLFPPAQNGADLNALLQDPGLAFHPPTLYMGYVGFSVAFAFAIAALLSGKLDTQFAKWTRPWTLIAWCFLTLGITAGSWWSYRELGWGGWWFWDPVENASFMPWLVGTALIHSLAVTEKRNTFNNWTILLAILAFSLSLLGTFLVRSGVLTSVHAFAMDPSRGAFMLKYLLVVVGASLLLYAIRAPIIKSGGEFFALSRESFLLFNNVILLVAMATILLGTLYPLILEASNLGKISVGPPYFNAMFIPLSLFLLFGMGIGPLCKWQKSSGKLLLKQLRISFILSITLGAIIPWMIHAYTPYYVPIALTFSFWAVMAMILTVWNERKKLTRVKFGMFSAHIGIAITVIGITLSSAYSIEKNVRMSPGDTAQLGPYTFKLEQISNISGSNYEGAQGDFLITKNDLLVNILHAQNRIYTVQNMDMVETAIDAGLFRDLYVAMAEPINDNSWAVRLYYKPFIRWIWAGGVLVFLGGLLAASDRRYFIDKKRAKS